MSEPREYIAISQPKDGASEDDRPVLIICVHKSDFEALQSKLAEVERVLEHMASDEFRHSHISADDFGEECRTEYIGPIWYAREALAKIKGDSK